MSYQTKINFILPSLRFECQANLATRRVLDGADKRRQNVLYKQVCEEASKRKLV